MVPEPQQYVKELRFWVALEVRAMILHTSGVQVEPQQRPQGALPWTLADATHSSFSSS